MKSKLLGFSNKTQIKLSVLVGDANMAEKKSSDEHPAEERRRRHPLCIAGILGQPRCKDEKDRLPKIKTQ